MEKKRKQKLHRENGNNSDCGASPSEDFRGGERAAHLGPLMGKRKPRTKHGDVGQIQFILG